MQAGWWLGKWWGVLYLRPLGALAQLARALAWHARGRRFDSDMLHK
jgi:hypothetical protein